MIRLLIFLGLISCSKNRVNESQFSFSYPTVELKTGVESDTIKKSLSTDTIQTFLLNDTLFIKRDLKISPIKYYHAIYIDSANSSLTSHLTEYLGKHGADLLNQKYESKLTRENYEKRYNEVFKRFYELENINLNPNKNENFPKDWINGIIFQNKLYAYSPCDFMSYERVQFSDTTIIQYLVDAGYPSLITEMDSSVNYFKISYKRPDYHDDKILNGTLEIKILDQKSKISIWKWVDTETRYQIMIPVLNISLVPIIDCYSPNRKMFELNDFDQENEQINLQILFNSH